MKNTTSKFEIKVKEATGDSDEVLFVGVVEATSIEEAHSLADDEADKIGVIYFRTEAKLLEKDKLTIIKVISKTLKHGFSYTAIFSDGSEGIIRKKATRQYLNAYFYVNGGHGKYDTKGLASNFSFGKNKADVRYYGEPTQVFTIEHQEPEIKLTEMETTVLKFMIKMDDYGYGNGIYIEDLAMEIGLKTDKLKGVVSSLCKKHLVCSDVDYGIYGDGVIGFHITNKASKFTELA